MATEPEGRPSAVEVVRKLEGLSGKLLQPAHSGGSV